MTILKDGNAFLDILSLIVLIIGMDDSNDFSNDIASKMIVDILIVSREWVIYITHGILRMLTVIQMTLLLRLAITKVIVGDLG